MEKQKPWQLALILVVLVLTIYNILPTVFYYLNDLQAPINEKRANQVVKTITSRVSSLEEESVEWVRSFCSLLNVQCSSVKLQPEDKGVITVSFPDEKQAKIFKKYLPRAGALIPFVPAQLKLGSSSDPKEVIVQRNIHVDFSNPKIQDGFRFSWLYNDQGALTEEYKEWIESRALPLALALTEDRPLQKKVEGALTLQGEPSFDLTLQVAQEMAEWKKQLGMQHPLVQANAKSMGRVNPKMAAELLAKMELLDTSLEEKEKRASVKKENVFDTESAGDSLLVLQSQRRSLAIAKEMLKKYPALFASDGQKEVGFQKRFLEQLAKSPKEGKQLISLEGYSPYFSDLLLDWTQERFALEVQPKLAALFKKETLTETESMEREVLQQMLIAEVASASRTTQEKIQTAEQQFYVQFFPLLGTKSFLSWDLGRLAEAEAVEMKENLRQSWQPEDPSLSKEAFPILTQKEWETLSPEEQRMGLIVYAPASSKETPPQGFRTGSMYVIAKGLKRLIDHYKTLPEDKGKLVVSSFQGLKEWLQQRGYVGYPGDLLGISKAFKEDYIFELTDFSAYALNATRESFLVQGDMRHAVLPFSTVEERLLKENKIADQIQEELLQWREDYQRAQVDMNPQNHYSVPKPVKSPFWSNLALSVEKYFKGDNRKILKWGLDLSGGKAVRVGLFDHDGRKVTEQEDLMQARDELYQRINKLGVSEQAIRIENDNILLEFPGSQGLSAEELVKASSMTFHLVNERFGTQNSELRVAVDQFLQDVWNEAVVTNQKDPSSLNRIAWERLGGDGEEGSSVYPRSEAAKLLVSHGLRLVGTEDVRRKPQFDDSVSMIARLRGEDASDWMGQTHPLLVVFANYALEGSSLTDVRVGYDATEGNTLSFAIKSSYDAKERTGNPRDDLYAWTSHFSEESIANTPLEVITQGRGWRMAVILNDQVISSPSLKGALRDHASITGRFTQREIQQLAADLKAGSLTFTPKILSENNISPDLGHEERVKGMVASLLSLVLVVVAMVSYYRFFGLVASCAVLFNLLIMWGVLQNIDAALTLPGLAGIVLTIGMAVDANVLVFERIKEEYEHSKRLISAIQIGYKKAFSAIIDSNITTIMAALILIQFDAGPIKGFAVTLIIGIVSSMFTALFVTRYYFTGWIQRTKEAKLSMSHWIRKTNFRFLAYSKAVVSVSLVAILALGALFYQERATMFGMDFTGGYALTVEVAKTDTSSSPRHLAKEALVAAGADPLDIEVKELNDANRLRIQLGMGLEETGAPFYLLPREQTNVEGRYDYLTNPRITWVVQALEKGGLTLPEQQLKTLSSNWSQMSGQFSDTMRVQAGWALGLALLAILLYIALRFEWMYAASAVIGLVHDVLITLGFLALFHTLGFAVQIDLVVVGAIMTIIGYSLNDTIIVFDRIREDMKLMRKSSLSTIIDHALNVTLSRTLMTSGTTLLVLVSLLVLGGSSIFTFSLVMTLGVVFGTFSSLFIAPLTLLWLAERGEEKKKQGTVLKFKNG